MEIYIIIRHIYYLDNCRLQQFAEANPVLGLFKDYIEAERTVDRLIECNQDKKICDRVVQSNPSSLCLAKYELFDGDKLVKDYTIYKDCLI